MNKTKINMIRTFFTIVFMTIFTISCQTHLPEKNDVKSIPYYEFAFYEIIRREGVQLNEYICPAGHLTVGIGQRVYSHTMLPKTLDNARKAAQTELQTIYNYVEKQFPKLLHNQKLAVSLFVYNFGKGFFERSDLYKEIKYNGRVNSTWKKYVYFKSSKTMEMVKSKNLQESRKNELALFNSNDEYILEHVVVLKENARHAYIQAKTKKI